MAKTTSLKREIILILIGAIISASTAFLTNAFNAKREDKRNNIQKKLEFNEQLSKDLGKRLYFTNFLYQCKRDNKIKSIDDANIFYKQSKEEWNIKRYSYESLLKHYYGEKIRVEFLLKVYNPLIKFGLSVESNKIDTSFQKKYVELQDYNIAFISKIYDLTEE
jgi:hypothetical protein